MKLKYFIVCILICICTIFTACGGNGEVDYDLSVTGFQFRYEMVTNMKNDPKEYKNKTIKLRGNLKSNGSTYYYLTETDNVCCTWKMEVKLDDGLTCPEINQEEVIVVGRYSTYTKNGTDKYYLQISEFVDNI